MPQFFVVVVVGGGGGGVFKMIASPVLMWVGSQRM